MKAFVNCISYYLPNNILNNELIESEFPEWSVDKISKKTGINERRIADNDETSLDLAFQAGKKLFSEHNVDKNTIDFIILCTQSPDYFLPTSACILQEKLGLSTSVGAFDFNLGCSGFVYGLGIAKGFICSGQAKNILLITSETYSKFIHPKDKSNKTIFGDAAAATLISNEGFAEILNMEYGTDGRGYKNLIVKNGALRKPLNQKDGIEDSYGNVHSDNHLYMNGTEIFLFTLSAVPKLVNQTLIINNLKAEDIDFYIFHQANKFMLESLRKKIKIDPEKFIVKLESLGNTVSSTIPIALYHSLHNIKSGNNVLLSGFGVGYSWAGTILKF